MTVRGESRSPEPRPRAEERPATARRLLVRRAIAFCAAGVLVAYLGFEGAGYDVVVRQGVALAVWVAVAIGFAVGVLPRAELSRLALVPLIAVAGLLLWMLVSLGWTASDERTTEEIARVLGFAGMMTLALAGLNRYTAAAAAAGISVAAFLVIGVAVLSRLSPSTFPHALDVSSRFLRGDRLTFPLDYWNAVGVWGAMAAAIGVAWSAHARLALTRAICLAAVPIAGLAVYLSYSRGGVIATAVAALAVVALSHNRWTAFIHLLAAGAGSALAIGVARGHDQIADATGAAGGGAVALALVGAAAICAGAVLLTRVMKADEARLTPETAKWAVPAFVGVLLVALFVAGRGPVSDAWDEFRYQDRPAASNDPAGRLTSAAGNRNDLWGSAIDAFQKEPLKGVGAGTFEFWWERKADDPEYSRDAHSLYLETLGELGLPGLLLLAGWLGGALAFALRSRAGLLDPTAWGAHVAMISAFVVFLVAAGIDWMWEETAVAALALGAIAVAAAGGARRRRRRERTGPLGRPGVRVAIVAVASLAALAQVPGLVSTERVRDSEAALAAGDVAQAQHLAKQAVDAEPWAATPHSQLALAYSAGGRLGAARREAEEAVGKEPTNWRWPLVLAPLEAQLGDRRAAIRTFRQGHRLAPQLPFYFRFGPYAQAVYTQDQLRRIFERQQQRIFERQQRQDASAGPDDGG